MGEFSVVQYFADGSHEYVCRNVSALEALRSAADYSQSLSAQMGNTRRVIVTDGDDRVVLEWENGKGVNFPLVREPPNPHERQGILFRHNGLRRENLRRGSP